MRLHWLSITVAFGCAAQGARAQGPKFSPDPKQEIGRIVFDIEKNYAQIRTMRVILQTTSVDRTVKQREEVTTKLPGGGTIQFTRTPSSLRRERILLSGDDLLRESMDEDGTIWAFRDGIYTQYSPKHHMVWYKYPDQMPGMLPLDPRNIASAQQKWRFVDRLREDRVIEINETRAPDGEPRVSALLEQTFEGGFKIQYRCEFDPARNNLPTRFIELREGDKVGIVLDIGYQEVVPGSAWFLRKATCKYFGVKPAESPDSDAWSQSLTFETLGRLHVNTPVARDAFEVNLPKGTRVSDSTQITNRKKKENPQER